MGAHVIAAAEQDSVDYRGALFLTSRETLVDHAGDGAGSDSELERSAAMLTELADRLGG